ncbi:MAG: ribosome biogenesis GTPase YlqF [Clostridia bacterium]|nr:ribosome biogenesis GTPase YlqF [Clostridia bacterium]
MPSQTIQWFPGHMAKTRRLITENLSQVDIVIELLDARIPKTSKNPEIDRLTAGKPKLTLLTKASLADPAATSKWVAAYSKNANAKALAVDVITGEGVKGIAPAIREILAEKLKRYEMKGMSGRKIRAMIVGIPNVGKSSLVNKLGGGKKAKVEDRPGVTLTKQWVTTSIGIELLDMPGVLWPKFDDAVIGENLAFTGAIRDAILDVEELAAKLCMRLYKNHTALFCARYKLDAEKLTDLSAYDLLCAVARRRGFLISGGELDTERASTIVLDEFREGKIGRITLELPESAKKKAEAKPTENPESKSEEKSVQNTETSSEAHND